MLTGLECQKKWINIRDQFSRNKGKKLGTGSSAESKKKRNELMAFLDEATTVNKRYMILYLYVLETD